MPERPIHNRPRKRPTTRFAMQMPDDELADLEMVVARLDQRRAIAATSGTPMKAASSAKIVRLALRQLFGSLTTEQLQELLEITAL